ncbi:MULTISPECIES: isoaspartyl peptidase/L-asparaginase family protein [Thermococcus]|uniref:Plant-type L-asparaginase n=2 Tax=Thermococcus sibiricus TaxID=172049 RepID=C6A147_THESM|nr:MULTISPECIES: isoaspartyl peptidase/L-asparaginase family protein [Thermococcus]KUK28380.1 MAG: Asparaginase [Thermococcus sp. 40_45]HII66751.1 asparaginase [Thermococcaceae archaeon]ACS89342.1 Asparaginase [Thermococcus sibiricus MM 739]KUK18442.1 MAG: Asparaginase [Thermococcus sibiricus]MBC7095729.1 isoaspartyl peptidase/L-asparaginase [Thermococcus sp.]
MVAIIVHGGAGTIKNKERIPKVMEGVRNAALIGWKELKRGSAIDAVEEAIKTLEDNPIFNAGTGSVLTLDGKVEMDAAIMRSNLEAGAVAGIWGVKNPISIARKVMEKTDHVLLAGEGAVKFARLMGFGEYNPIIEERIEQWKKLREKLLEKGIISHWKKISELIKEYPEVLRSTVGAVAFDGKEIVAGTSTGGVFLKMFGRVGDTPIIGAGTYANEFAGVSCTGLGEVAIKLSLAKTATDFVRFGLNAQKASEAAIELATRYFGSENMGIIMVDKNGNIGFAKNTKHMSVAYMKESMEEPETRI